MELENNPTLPQTELEIDGRTYRLCFTFGALAKAQSKLRRAGSDVNVLLAIPAQRDAEIIPVLLLAAMLEFQPEMTLESVTALVTLKNLNTVMGALNEVITASMPDGDGGAEKNDPGQELP